MFKLERLILAWAIRRPSSDAEARELAAGQRDDFAAWHVEARAENQLLLCDLNQRTRSWLMLRENPEGVWLYFGSAVVSDRRPNRRARMQPAYRALLGFHRLYSRLLLGASLRRLQR